MHIATIADAVAAGRILPGQAPWPRVELDAVAWRAVADRLADGTLALLGLWADGDTVHLAARGESVAVFSIVAIDGRYPSVARVHLPAMRLERSIRDLFGLDPEGLPDPRPWLDHGAWGVAAPLRGAV